MAARMALTVIGGFLGAGKTTLLNHWLRQHQGGRVALLVNDFGALNIDADLIAQQHGDTLALTNGCVCCTLGDDLSLALIRVLEAQPPFEAVIIEASGVSDPGRIARLAQAAPELRRDAVLVLVDASAVREQWQDPLLADTLQRQLQAADLLVLNKCDLVDASALAEVQALLQAQAPGVPVLQATQGQVPAALLMGQALQAQAHQHDPGCGCGHTHGPHAHADDAHLHGDLFEAWNAHPAAARPLAAWRAALDGLPDGVLRLKGLVATPEQGWTEVQRVGRRLQLRAAGQGPADGQAVLVAIGLRAQLPRAALQALAQAPLTAAVP